MVMPITQCTPQVFNAKNSQMHISLLVV